MTALHWRKAAPGMYYLWDGPSTRKDKVLVASAKTFSARDGYQIAILLNPEAKFAARCGLQRALALVETAIRERAPDATFSRDNF